MPQLLEPEQLYPKSHFQRSLDHAQETMHPVADYLQRAADGRGKKCKSEMNDARDTTSDDQQDTIHFWRVLRILRDSEAGGSWKPQSTMQHQDSAIEGDWRQISRERLGKSMGREKIFEEENGHVLWCVVTVLSQILRFPWIYIL